MNIKLIFKEPYPYEDDYLVILRNYFGASIFVVFFLVIFRPFGLATLQIATAFGLAAFFGYGAVTFIICVLFDKLSKISFPRFFDDRKWTVGHQIISMIVLVFFIGLGNLFYSHFMGFTGISGTTMLYFQMYTVLIAVFPISIITMITRVQSLKKHIREAVQINTQISINDQLHSNTNDILVFSSENEKEMLELTLGQFVYAESADNYSEIVFLENNIVRRVLMRSSLKRLLEMNKRPELYLIHRSYFVNINKIVAVEGNSRGYRCDFKEVEESIPVSRRNAQGLKDALGKLL